MQILMPKLGLTMTEGTLIEWLKAEGERVHQSEPLFLFESEKAVMEFEAPADGVLTRILVQAGATVDCGTPVAAFASGEELAPDVEPPLAQPAATPAARRRASELGLTIDAISGRGPGGRVQLIDVEEAAAKAKQPVEVNTAPTKSLAAPLASALAADLGVDLARVRGTGPRGRIMREDVLAFARRALSQKQTPPPSLAVDASPYQSRQPLTGVRAVIARRMSASAFTAPHVTLHTEADATFLVAARQQINQALAGEIKLSYNTLLVALVARALHEQQEIAACLVEDEVRIYTDINIALAVDTERGLLVPVIRHADRLDVVAIQQVSDALIQRALAGKSLPEDLTDGVFTMTNLGAFDIDGFTPIINQPQAAILGVGRILSKPVDVGGRVGLRQMMTLSLSFDHRIIDGGPAAQFLQRVKRLIERPFSLIAQLND